MSRNMVKNVEDLWDNYNKDKNMDQMDQGNDFLTYTSRNYHVQLKNMLEELESPNSVRHINSRIVSRGSQGQIKVHCGDCHYESGLWSINIREDYVRDTKVDIGSARCKGCNKLMYFIRRVKK